MDRRQFVIGSTLIAGTGISLFASRPTQRTIVPQAALERSIPATVGRYHEIDGAGIVLPPRDDLSRQIYDRYVARGYAAPGLPPIMMVIAYGATQNYGLQLHLPETCYPASGWKIGPSATRQIALSDNLTVDGTMLEATRSARRETILYWTRIGKNFPNSLWAGRMDILRGAVRRDLPDGVLMRLSTPARGPAALEALRRFNLDLIKSVDAKGRHLLLGPSA